MSEIETVKDLIKEIGEYGDDMQIELTYGDPDSKEFCQNPSTYHKIRIVKKHGGLLICPVTQKSKNSKKDSNISHTFGDELLCAIFANFTNGMRYFKVTERDIINLFFRLLNKPEYKSFANNYVFDADGPEPESKYFSNAFSSLQATGLISIDADGQYIYLKLPVIKIRYEKFIEPKINNKNLLEKLSKEVEEELTLKTALKE